MCVGGGLKVALSTESRKRLTKSPPNLKGGGAVPKLIAKKSGKAQRERRSKEMEICLDVQSAIDQCLINASSLGELPISGVLSALETEPDESKNLEYF